MNFDHSPIMDDPYQYFLTSMSRVGPEAIAEYPTTQGQAFPGVSGDTPPFNEPPIAGHQATQESVALDGSKSKGRKKSTVANPGDIVKHRRTRSGCFTCRSRRVKCDENRPVCQRCLKGNRECVYPEPAPQKKSATRSSRSKDASQTSPLSSTGDQEDGGDTNTRLQTIIDQEEPEDDKEAPYSYLRSNSTATSSAISAASGRHGSETPSQDDNRSSPSSSTVASSGFAIVPYDPSDFPLPSERLPDLSHLPSDYQYYLRWYDDNVTYYHYGVNHDTDDFFKTILPRTALINEALLNALVGFTAYQITMQNPDGKIQDFLGYYNKSVTLLLGFLRKKERHDVSTLMTILQLAQIEEYLGDWVNILGHQKAALEIFTKIFTPQTVMQTPLGRMCLSWFMRFDGFVAFRGSFPNGLPKDYVDTMREYYRSQMAKCPGDLNWIIADRCAHIRQISWHQALLYARRIRGQISFSDFAMEHQQITDALMDYRNSWDPAITDPKYLVTDFGGREPHPDDIANPYEPGILYEPPLFSSTVADAEWHGVLILHLLLTPNRTKEEMFPELQKHAFAICRCYETVQYWPHAPKGAMLQQHTLIKTAFMFLPRDKKHEMWIRRKTAHGESIGHMCPVPAREQIANFFGDPSCVRWWLPNDEGFTPILQSVREFADQRNAVAVTAQQESVREAKYLYKSMSEMKLGDSPRDDHGKA